MQLIYEKKRGKCSWYTHKKNRERTRAWFAALFLSLHRDLNSQPQKTCKKKGNHRKRVKKKGATLSQMVRFEPRPPSTRETSLAIALWTKSRHEMLFKYISGLSSSYKKKSHKKTALEPVRFLRNDGQEEFRLQSLVNLHKLLLTGTIPGVKLPQTNGPWHLA